MVLAGDDDHPYSMMEWTLAVRDKDKRKPVIAE
jgi:hypothetical protein